MQSHRPFIIVLVDGNRVPLLPDLIAQGSLGGYLAANKVRSTVEESLWRSGLKLFQFAIPRIILFADLEKLARSNPQKNLPIQDFFSGFDFTHFETAFHEIDKTFVSRKDLECEPLLKRLQVGHETS